VNEHALFTADFVEWPLPLLRLLLEIRSLPDTTDCPVSERSWGASIPTTTVLKKAQ
jgi:hypothetical protein